MASQKANDFHRLKMATGSEERTRAQGYASRQGCRMGRAGPRVAWAALARAHPYQHEPFLVMPFQHVLDQPVLLGMPPPLSLPSCTYRDEPNHCAQPHLPCYAQHLCTQHSTHGLNREHDAPTRQCVRARGYCECARARKCRTHAGGNVCARAGTGNARAHISAWKGCIRDARSRDAPAHPECNSAYKLICHRWRLTVRARWAGSDAAGASRIGMRGGRRASRCEDRGLITLAASPSGWRARLNDDSSACGKTDTGGTTGRGCYERNVDAMNGRNKKTLILYCSGRRYKRVCTAVEDGTKS